MHAQDGPALSIAEITSIKQKLERKDLEIHQLQKKLAEQNLEMMNLQTMIEEQHQQFFFKLKTIIRNLLRFKFSMREYRRRDKGMDNEVHPIATAQTRYRNTHNNTHHVTHYPDIVVIKASNLFDSDWYLTHYPEVAFSGLEPAQHYLQIGANKGYDPSPNFKTDAYRTFYPDVAHMNPLLHYEIYGRAEGRCVEFEKSTSEQFNLLEKHIKIIFISGDADTPGHIYRIGRYAAAAKMMGALVTEYDVAAAYDHLEELYCANLIFVWRAKWNTQLSSIYAAARKAKIPIIFDIDDLLIDPMLAKVEIVDSIRTTGSSEEITRNFFKSLQLSMENADYCSAPTSFLVNYMRAFNKKTFYLPNGFDEQTWYASRLARRKRLAHPHDGLIRIGYAGGSRTHQKDFAIIANVIARLLRERPNCRFVLFRKGEMPATDINEFPALLVVSHQIEWRELVPLNELPYEMARFDINVAPLEVGNAFCEAKSELKFFESALVEVPIVVSPTQTFCEAIEDGKTGFFAQDETSWYDILTKLLDDAPLRKKIGRYAYDSVLWKYGSEERMNRLTSMIDMMFYAGSRRVHAFQLNLLKSQRNELRIPKIPAHDILACYDRLSIADVTVVVPCDHDGADGYDLIDSLESVRKQTLLNIDLIIVDDCSQDNHTLDIAMQWIKAHKDRFNRVLLIKNKNKYGLGLSKNIGFAHAETLFVMTLNPNHLLHENFATICLQKIKETNAAFVYTNIQNLEHHPIQTADAYHPLLSTFANTIGGTAFIRLSAWAYVGGYQQLDLNSEEEEDDFWCQFVEYGMFGYHVDDILITQRV